MWRPVGDEPKAGWNRVLAGVQVQFVKLGDRIGACADSIAMSPEKMAMRQEGLHVPKHTVGI
jgi:hypothetical protein